MDGFKKLPKMQCFKTGGKVEAKAMCYGGKAMKKGGEVEKDDMAQDKKLIKRAFKQHDEAEHDKEPTEIKLKKGGRAKKDCGTVRKYKAGGSVENVYGAKKTSGDLDRIERTKDIKPGKAADPSKAATKPDMEGSDVAKEKSKPAGDKDIMIKSKQSGKEAAAASGAKEIPNKYKKGGEVKKMADGSSVNANRRLAELEAMQRQARRKNAMQLGPAQQSQLINQSPSAAGLAPTMGAPMPAPAPTPMAPPTSMPAQKRGGKVKKGC
jgi:hypothetical protein